jgi:outer membrane protein assembly factor BamE (lipoprotein component of BamABCDE complex)
MARITHYAVKTSSRMRATRSFAMSVAILCASCAQYPVITDDRASAIVAGMSGDDVVTRLGEPYQRVAFANLNATAWDYRYTDTWGYRVAFSVMMGNDGRVVNKVSRRMERPDNH